MPEPPHSLQYLRCLPCSQISEPPHSLQYLRRLPCSQISEPPHSLHFCRSLPCSQMPEPPHSLHVLRRLPCSQIPFPGHSLQKYPPRLLPCTHVSLLPCAPEERGRFPRAEAMAEFAVGCDARLRRRAPAETFLKLHFHVLRSEVEKNGSRSAPADSSLPPSPAPRAARDVLLLGRPGRDRGDLRVRQPRGLRAAPRDRARVPRGGPRDDARGVPLEPPLRRGSRGDRAGRGVRGRRERARARRAPRGRLEEARPARARAVLALAPRRARRRPPARARGRGARGRRRPPAGAFAVY